MSLGLFHARRLLPLRQKSCAVCSFHMARRVPCRLTSLRLPLTWSSCWIHPINQRREDLSSFNTLFTDLREDEMKIFILWWAQSFFKRCSKMPGLKNEKLHKACKQARPTDASTRPKYTTAAVPCGRFHRTIYYTEVQLRHGGRVL